MTEAVTDSEIMLKGFHQLLRESFKDKNLSEISRKLEIPRSLLQDWVHEGRVPSMKNLEHIKRIADYLGYSLDELLLGESSKRIISSIEFEDSGRKYQVIINRIK